jgi:CHAT domain-containing protein
MFFATGEYLNAGFNVMAEETFVKIESVLPESFEDAGWLSACLAETGSTLEGRRGAPIVLQALQYWGRLLPYTRDERPLVAFQAVKGAQLASALSSAILFNWQLDAGLCEMLAEIKELREKEKSPNGLFQPNIETESTLLFSSSEGALFSQVYSNNKLLKKEIAFDQHIFSSVALDHKKPSEYFINVSQIQGLLDSRSILVSFLDVPIRQQPNTHYWHLLYAFIITSDQIQLIEIEDPAGWHIVSGANGETWDRYSKQVLELRRLIQQNQDESKIKEQLSSLAERVFPKKLYDIIKELSLGYRDHLLIHPHGSLHFCPFHLFDLSGILLGEEWIITHLPTIGQLILKSEHNAIRRPSLAAFGLTFENHIHGFGREMELPEVASEVRCIAETFNSKPYVNTTATKAALFTAFDSVRYIHIATHGAHFVPAPAFQCLYLHPDETSDGVLYAYEVLGKKLNGIDLITLSACDTALGRYDHGDNLRGMPAYLMMAGVASIIGTLWEAGSESCEFFFVTLYEKLYEGEHKLNAFHHAQLETRRHFPDYRDWGAFHFSGI